MKVVLDTNILVSALIKPGKARDLLFKVADSKAQLVLSESIIEEFLEVAEDPRIRRYVSGDDMIAFLRATGSMAKIVKVRSRFKVVKEDPDDDVVLRTAHDSRADYIGDDHLLRLGKFRRTRIVTVNEMLQLLEKQGQ